MANFDWKSLVKSVAPMLGTALGGPFGGIAGAALAKCLGTDKQDAGGGADDASLAAALQGATPDQLLALKKADEDFHLQMTQLGYKNTAELEAIAAGDRANARGREVSLRDWTPRMLAYGVTLGFFGVLAFMLRSEIPAGSRDVLNVMLGSLGTAWISVVTYYFGSSAGSSRKTELLGSGK